MIKFGLFIIFIVYSNSVLAQVNDIKRFKFGSILNLYVGSVSNKEIQNYIDDDISYMNWVKTGELNERTFGIGCGINALLNDKFNCIFSLEYFSSDVSSHSKVRNSGGGYSGNGISYVYSRFSIGMNLRYQFVMYKRLRPILSVPQGTQEVNK